MKEKEPPKKEFYKMVLVRGLIIYLCLFAMFFLPAGTLDYWQAWVSMGILLIPFTLAVTWFARKRPEFIKRRMRMKEKETGQKKIVIIAYIPFVFGFLLPGFDKRFGWSQVPDVVVIIADIFVLLSYGLILLTFKENQFASRTVEVEKGQTVISSGPYAFVRHPMYLGSIFLYTLTPLALGSFWAMIPAAMIIPVIIARIRNEEEVLVRDLKGYKQYMEKTRYRLIPGIW